MQSYLIHHTPRSPSDDTWAVSFSLPYIAASYARAGDGVWYVKTWLTAEQIKKRLAILFDDMDELHVHTLSRGEAALNARLKWLDGRLEHEDDGDDVVSAPRMMWDVLQSAVQNLVPVGRIPAAATVATLRSSRAA